MDITASDYIIGGYAVGLALRDLRALKRNNYKPIYKDVIKTAG
ncbi:MAG: hypothetical protein JWM07_571, partial [Candidatus Saccharibacteria bacterium]|nr:hypothetical protein [Candidatus Saccharibacteria bacterium]